MQTWETIQINTNRGSPTTWVLNSVSIARTWFHFSKLKNRERVIFILKSYYGTYLIITMPQVVCNWWTSLCSTTDHDIFKIYSKPLVYRISDLSNTVVSSDAPDETSVYVHSTLWYCGFCYCVDVLSHIPEKLHIFAIATLNSCHHAFAATRNVKNTGNHVTSLGLSLVRYRGFLGEITQICVVTVAVHCEMMRGVPGSCQL